MSRSSDRHKAVTVAASILSADPAAFGTAVDQARDGGADWLHLDVMDGHFVPNLSFGQATVAALARRTSLFCDVHLMVSDPAGMLPEMAAAGARSVSVHVEATPHLHRLLRQARDLGMRCGAALNPGTPLSSVETVLAELDLLLIMTVDPGFGGQAFIESMLPKVAAARQMLDRSESHALLQVDGGVDARTAPGLLAVGAQVLVSGSGLYGHPGGVAAGVAALREAASEN